MRIRDSHEADARRLAPNLRRADLAEIQASTGQRPVDALFDGYRGSSHCRSLVDANDLPIGMFGVCPDLDMFSSVGLRYGWVWFLGADAATASPKEFMVLSRSWLRRLQEDFDVLGNYVDCRNVKHIKWLRAMGFTFLDVDASYGHEGRPFIEFQLFTPEVSIV